MRPVSELKNYGKDKKCLIIGGGMSVLDFDFKTLPQNVIIMSVNDSIPDGIDPDFLIYNDVTFIPVLKKIKISNKTKIISFINSYCSLTDYYYRLNDLGVNDDDNTGVKAIILCKEIMMFEKIYLIGFDFHCKEIDGKKQSHFNGDKIGKDEKYSCIESLEGHYRRLSKMIKEFDKVKNISNIFNCNEQSSLKKFQFGLPYPN